MRDPTTVHSFLSGTTIPEATPATHSQEYSHLWESESSDHSTIINLIPSIDRREHAKKKVIRARCLNRSPPLIVRSPHPGSCRHQSFYDPNRRDTSADNAWHGARQAREQGALPVQDLIA